MSMNRVSNQIKSHQIKSKSKSKSNQNQNQNQLTMKAQLQHSIGVYEQTFHLHENHAYEYDLRKLIVIQIVLEGYLILMKNDGGYDHPLIVLLDDLHHIDN